MRGQVSSTTRLRIAGYFTPDSGSDAAQVRPPDRSPFASQSVAGWEGILSPLPDPYVPT
jgi:hypothetical protein